KAATAGLGKRQPESFSGRYASPLSREGAIAVFRNMLKGGQRKKNFFLDIDFTRPTSASPQQQLLLQAIERNYPNIGEMTLHSSTAPDAKVEKGHTATLPASVIPRAVRRYQDHGAPYTRLSRFFHDTASFYQSEKQEELVASPFEALAQSPAASALFMEMDARRVELPVFLPQRCTGCGQCTVACPHAAIPPLAIGVESLVKGAMAIAASRGTPVAQITPLVKNLSRLAGPAVKSAAQNAARVAEMLPTAFDRLLEQMKITGDKAATVRQEWAILLDIIGEWPVAVTETFFLEAEAREKGSGEFFTLAINPYACTGCGICAEACPEGALEMKPQELPLVQSLQATYGLWEQLPDTSSETISRLVHDPAYDSFAAILLSRNYYQSMAGGSLTESGAPAKGMLHLVAALTESIVQPRIVKLALEAGELIEALQENIHAKLSNALPREDLLALEKAVGESAGSSLPLDELVGKLGEKEHLKLVDTAVLHRKIALANDLKALRWSMLEGPTGAGRARFGLILQAGLWPWAEQYPYNSFLAPVLLDGEGASAGLASGLFQGHLRHALDNIKLLRRARLEAKDKYRPEADGPEIAALGWEALDEAERGLVPPLLLVGNQSLLEGPQREALDALLASPWPIKIFCLDEAAPAEEDTPRQLARGNAALFAAAALRNAYVWQGSLGASRELFDGLRQGISRPRPAIYHLLAVNLDVHEGYEQQWPRLASLALDTRAFPLFAFDPETEDGFLSLATSLSGNPGPDADWGENKAQQYQLTYADWLYTLRAWQSHFRPLSTEEAAALPVGDYLNLSPDARKDKIPVIQTAGEKGQAKQLAVSQQVVAATDAARHQWRMLREMAGTLTPFPGKLRKQVEQELTEKYERELAQLRSDYEEKLQNQEQELMQQVRIKLRDKLVALSQTPRS
ncbi:MAG: 4Fe-4S binding protein, partial [Phaeodactylibacter sp.]|nr:4Fe-4S binding protein [Phaeodactylibacter sp.]